MEKTAPNGKRAFEHVIIIVFENEYRSYALQDPYLASLAAQGTMLRNSFGVMHPSQTNYVSSIAGELCGVYYDTPVPAPLTQKTIVDLIEDAGLTWRGYMESYVHGNPPWSPNFVPTDDFPYLTKHNPFASFANIQKDPHRWAKIGNEADFWTDVMNGTLPNYAWFTPNMWSDGHYLYGQTGYTAAATNAALLKQCSDWLRGFFAKLRFPGPDSHLPANTLVVITFDEADFEAYDPTLPSNSYYDGPNQIYTVLLGDMIQPGVELEGYNHYSLLRTVEKNFALGDLGKNDAEANWFRFLWGQRLVWTKKLSTSLRSQEGVAATFYKNMLHVATRGENGDLEIHVRRDIGWSKIFSTDLANQREYALGATGEGLNLFFITPDNQLMRLPMGQKTPVAVAPQALSVAAAGLSDKGLMVAWTDGKGEIHTMRTDDGINWDAAVDTGQTSDVGVALARQGQCLHLLYPKGTCLQWLTMNLADFNVLPTNAPSNSLTTQNLWSPSSFPVADFEAWPNPLTPGEPEPREDFHRGKAPLSAATLDGVVHFVYAGMNEGELVRSEMSIPGLMTPRYPVNYHATTGNFSNGFGTAAQAGWARQTLIAEAAGSMAVALAADGNQMAMVTLDGGGAVQVIMAGYAAE